MRQPKAHGSLKGLQETRLVFSIQKSLSVTIGQSVGQSARPTTVSQRLSRPRLSSFLSFCTCSLRLLMSPMSRPCRLLTGARVVRVPAGVSGLTAPGSMKNGSFLMVWWYARRWSGDDCGSKGWTEVSEREPDKATAKTKPARSRRWIFGD